MQKFVIKTISVKNPANEISKIGYDKSYVFRAVDKFAHLNLKIFDVTSAQANILKQSALSVGADCATNKNVITGQAEKSDCILGGNYAQLQTIAQKLKLQPFGLSELACEIEQQINIAKNQSKTKIVGVLNLTQNSFSDGGLYYKTEDALKHLEELITDGADIIDIGAESTKPYSSPVSFEKQLELLIPVLEYVNKQNIKVPISIDTRSSVVAKECIKLGASIINDVSGLEYDEAMADVVAGCPDVKVIIQHSKGTPENMQDSPVYENLIDEIFMSLKDKTDYAMSKGVKKENIIVDAGIGFGKSREDNFEIIQRWSEFKSLGYPVMLGVSRKSLLNMPDASNDEKDVYSLALGGILMNQGLDYLRVHNVKIHKKFLNMLS